MDNDKNFLNINSIDPLLNRDSIQERLDSVNRRLGRPAFLQDITSSRLPSQAASDSSISPGDAPLHARSFLREGVGAITSSPLARAVDVQDDSDIEPGDIPHHSLSIESAILELDFKNHDGSHDEIDPNRFTKLRNSFVQAWQSFQRL